MTSIRLHQARFIQFWIVGGGAFTIGFAFGNTLHVSPLQSILSPIVIVACLFVGIEYLLTQWRKPKPKEREEADQLG